MYHVMNLFRISHFDLYYLYSNSTLAEIWVDMKQQRVTKILSIPENYQYRNIPVALY